MDKYLDSGRGVTIGNNCVFGKTRPTSNQGLIKFGDYTTIHDNCQFYISDEHFITGDYCTFHKNILATGYKSCDIGHNVWFGQNSIINSTDSLKIGNNCGFGAYSKIWTHAAWGDVVEGCRLLVGVPDMDCKSGAITIGDDFWGVGSITISPGVTIGNKVIALTNSLITKDVPDNTVVAGTPAKPVSIDGDVSAYKKLNSDEKYQLMKKFSADFAKINKRSIDYDDEMKKISINDGPSANKRQLIINCSEVSIEKDTDAQGYGHPESTFFDVLKRTYTKKHNELEVEFMKFLMDYKIRFTPE